MDILLTLAGAVCVIVMLLLVGTLASIELRRRMAPPFPASRTLSDMRSGRQSSPQEIIRFLAVGAIGMAVHAGIYAALTLAEASYALAWAGAWAVSVPAGYLLHRTVTFQSRTKMSRSFPRVVMVYAGQQLILLGSIAALVIVGIDQLLAYWISVPIAVGFSFLTMKHFGFR